MSLRLFLFTAGFAFVALAQNPGPAASIQIVSDEDQVLVGNSLPMRAVVRDAQGRIRSGDTVTWGIDNRAIADINAQSGIVRAVGLGIAVVNATMPGGIRAETPVQTMPREVVIEPRTAELEVGQTLQFRATALDVNGNAIPVTWAWSVANKNAGGTTLATVTNTGLVRGVFEGGITVRATYTYNRNVFGMQRQWLVSSPVDVSVPRAYELVKMRTPRQRDLELRARNSMLWGTDDGQLYFNASLGGLGNGLLNWNYDNWKLVGAGGSTRFTSGSFATDYRVHSITGQGRIMTVEATNGAGVQVNWGNKEGVVPFLANSAPLAETENGNNFFLTRNSFTDSGWVLVRASYRVPGSNPAVNGVGLFRGYGDRLTELLVSNLDTLPGLTGALNVDGDFGITEGGVAYYTVSQGANRVLYRHHTERQQLLRTGDAAVDSTVRGFLGGGGNRPTFFVSPGGDLLYGVVLNNNAQYFMRHPAGAERPQTLRLNSQSGFLWHNAEGGTLLYGNPVGSRGNGVHVWDAKGEVRPVAIFGTTQVAAQGIQDCESGFIGPNGDASLMMRLSTSNMLVARFFAGGGDPWVLFQHGDRIPVEAPVNMLNFVGGGRVGPVHLMTGGENGSITQAADGAFLPIVPIGSRLFGTQMWFGGSTNNSNYNMRKAPNGDIYFTTGLGLGRVKVGSTTPELFLRFNLPLPGVANQNIFTPFWVDANSRGDVLWVSSTSLGDTRVYVTSPDGQTHREVLVYSAGTNTATSLDGKIATGIDSYAIDDDGRVMMNVRFRNETNPTAYLWENGRFTFLVRANETTIAGKPIVAVTNIFRAGGRKLFGQFQAAGGFQILCEWVDGAWKVVLDNTERLMHGQVINSVNAFDVNRNGDILFLHSAGTPYLMVRRADGRTVMVMNQFKPTSAGEYIIRFLNVDFRDDGTVYFLGVNSSDAQVLYQARPLN